jgi:hypothetical protein
MNSIIPNKIVGVLRNIVEVNKKKPATKLNN